jgi:hypothetical protein
VAHNIEPTVAGVARSRRPLALFVVLDLTDDQDTLEFVPCCPESVAMVLS